MHVKFWSENVNGRDQSEDNIRMDLREIVWGIVDWIHLAQDRDH
jgi:hypothetical protein